LSWKECSEAGKAGSSEWVAAPPVAKAQPPRFHGRINRVGGPVSTNFHFLGLLPPLEIGAQYKKLASDRDDSNALILNDSAEMPHREPREPSRVGVSRNVSSPQFLRSIS
jgi:hypothetical protein